jgi:predicted RNA-binding protein YlxR (DUF448 family)
VGGTPSTPVRTCLACRRTIGKSELVRIVRSPDGEVRIDPTGKAAGRGAYVHREEPCIARVARAGLIARALRTPLGGSEAARLVTELRASLGGDR